MKVSPIALMMATALVLPGVTHADPLRTDRSSAQLAEAKPTPVQSGHVEANGVRYYYEVHGKGEPLLLLHGGLGSIDMSGPVLPLLAAQRQVVGVDLHGHGRTALGSRKISLIDTAAADPAA